MLSNSTHIAGTATNFARRRKELAKLMQDGVAIFFAANSPTSYSVPYQQNSNFAYLTGYPHNNAALVIIVADKTITDEILYIRPLTQVEKKWQDKQLSIPATKKKSGIQQIKVFDDPCSIVKQNVLNQHKVFLDLQASDHDLTKVVIQNLSALGMRQQTSLHNSYPLVSKLRMIKDATEIDAITTACAHTVKAFATICATITKAKNERDVLAQLTKSYLEDSCTHAFLPIVGNGANACIAHYVANNSKLVKGNLLLIDTGAQKNGYASDMTRVLPVGDVSNAKKEVIDVVCKAQQKAIKKISLKTSLEDVQKVACLELARGLISLGICRGKPNKVVLSKTFKELYFHSIGHSLGIDVHDPFIKEKDVTPKFKAGMVVTMEPGLYLDDRQSIPKELRNTGVRIEDTVLVSNKKVHNLTGDAPKTSFEIAKLLRNQ